MSGPLGNQSEIQNETKTALENDPALRLRPPSSNSTEHQEVAPQLLENDPAARLRGPRSNTSDAGNNKVDDGLFIRLGGIERKV
jgi:hypothetical protein